ncbi:MAG: hypothetical protein ACE14P_00635 [Methanotrichaceae archaeon]
MKWTALLIASLMLLSLCAMGLPNQYSTRTSGGAPTPMTPTSPESLGLQMPSPIESSQAPAAQENPEGLMSTSQDMAYSAAPQGASLMAPGATGSAVTQMVIPPGGYAPNILYIAFAPQTVTGCYLYANLPLWLQTSGYGSAWFYEWYPSGRLDINYAGYINYPGWYKRWFFADVPGWHILQYNCNGWSNYAYVYVYGQGPSNWVNPGPYYQPNPLPYMPQESNPPIYPFPQANPPTGPVFN